jgi:hypothetical protein
MVSAPEAERLLRMRRGAAALLARVRSRTRTGQAAAPRGRRRASPASSTNSKTCKCDWNIQLTFSNSPSVVSLRDVSATSHCRCYGTLAPASCNSVLWLTLSCFLITGGRGAVAAAAFHCAAAGDERGDASPSSHGSWASEPRRPHVLRLLASPRRGPPREHGWAAAHREPLPEL